MIEKVIYGIVTAAFGLGAYLSARKMSRGPIYYYGKTIPKRPPERQGDENEPEREDAAAALAGIAALARLIALTGELEGGLPPEVLRVFAFALKDEYLTKLILAKVEARTRAKIHERFKETIREAGESETWKDDIETRLRKLEEKSAAEEGLAFATENPKAPNVERVH